jgi:hypothetical protein
LHIYIFSSLDKGPYLFFFFFSFFSFSPFFQQQVSYTEIYRERNDDKNLEQLWWYLASKKGNSLGNIFGVHSQCKSRTFLVDLNGTNIWWCILSG